MRIFLPPKNVGPFVLVSAFFCIVQFGDMNLSFVLSANHTLDPEKGIQEQLGERKSIVR